MSTVDITPSPRVLRMLGQIDFAPWQCLAELIDNSIDAFIDQAKAGQPCVSPRIFVQLPTDSQLRENKGEIIIKDNAAGMTLDRLENSVRAGYSGNDPVEKMGLFGMGFNISTARMGRKTEVWTTQVDDENWTGVVIDFDELERQKTFHAPVKIRSKTPSELANMVHGTEIKISALEAERVRPLIKGVGKKRTRDRLGKIYGRVMQDLGVSILYDSDVVSPRTHCAWDASRSVETKTFGRVPARIDLNHSLDPKKFCTTCWVWLTDSEEKCSSCGSEDHVIARQRKVKGWLGVQRYFDKEDFGIDLIRNGRVIEASNKSFFTFVDENGDEILDYPIDAIHWGGRLIGEIEIDFVRVSHQKDSFDKLDPEWKKVVEIVRGKSPLQPKIAENMNLPKNDSPLSRLFTAYRKAVPGLKDLVPGTPEGTGLNSGLVREYVDKFYEGDPDYQSDEKWYELVLQAERAKRGGSAGADDAAGTFPIGGSSGGQKTESTKDNNSSSKPAAATTASTKVSKSQIDTELSGNYAVDCLPGENQITVSVFRHNEDFDGEPYRVDPKGYKFQFDYNSKSKFFEENARPPAEYMIADLAQQFLTLASVTIRDVPLSKVIDELRSRYFSDLQGDLQSATLTAEALVDEVRRHYDETLSEKAPIDVSVLSAALLGQAKKSALKSASVSPEEVEKLIREGKFVRFIPTNFIQELVQVWPDLIMDGKFFSKPYFGLAEELQRISLNEVLNGFDDLFWLLDDGASAISKDQAWRLRYSKALASIKLLQYWRS